MKKKWNYIYDSLTILIDTIYKTLSSKQRMKKYNNKRIDKENNENYQFMVIALKYLKILYFSKEL